MGNIVVGRYSHFTPLPEGCVDVADEWQGWIEPEDHSWIAFIAADGKPTFFLNRDPETGAVLEQAA
jgi:hypothetical protein